MKNFLENQDILKSYQNLAKEILDFVGDRNWHKATLKCEIYNTMVSKETFYIFDNQEFWQGNDISLDVRTEASEAVFFIRNFILKEQGQRIWGLTFTLYPDGKFEIEYDYDKPEDYEETDEIITGEEINQTFLK